MNRRLRQGADDAEVLARELLNAEKLSIESCLAIIRLLVQKRVLLNPETRLSPSHSQSEDEENEVSVYSGERSGVDKYVIGDIIDRLTHISAAIDSKAGTDPRKFLPLDTVTKGKDEGAANEENRASLLVNPLDLIAAVICETYAELGEDAAFADDEALILIRDVLLEAEPGIIERNRGKCVAARGRIWDRLEQG